MASLPSPPASGPDVVAAGAVVARKGPRGREVLLVHRPKYDDWSFPKGKQDPGEHVTATAIREVLEETGVEIRLGRPLRPQLYAVSGGRAKKVHYWVGEVVGDDDVSTYAVNEEVDELGWFRPREARARLTYLDDMDLLEQWHAARKAHLGAGRRTARQGRQARRLEGRGPAAPPQRPRLRPGRGAQAAAARLRRLPGAVVVQRALHPDPRAVRRGAGGHPGGARRALRGGLGARRRARAGRRPAVLPRAQRGVQPPPGAARAVRPARRRARSRCRRPSWSCATTARAP